MIKQINLNADLGESFGHYKVGDDAGVMQYIKSASVACGFHGGDAVVMDNAVKLAAANGISTCAATGRASVQSTNRLKINMHNLRIKSSVSKSEVIQAACLKRWGHLPNRNEAEDV